jgi:hypothetical protein
MRILVTFCLCCAGAALLFPAGCTKSRDVSAPIVIDSDIGTFEKHRVQERSSKKWVVLSWTNCTATKHGHVQVFFRIISSLEEISGRIGVAHFELKSAEGDLVDNQVEHRVRFKECEKMQSRLERSFDDDNLTWGEVEQFPPKGPCAEASVNDPFGIMHRGRYFLTLKLMIDDGSVFQFNPIQFSVGFRD